MASFVAVFKEVGSTFNARLGDDPAVFGASFGEVQVVHDVDWYEGEYEVIPSSETQILQTDGLAMRENVVIKPIPSNYGLITWNGSFLTVS